MANYEVWVEFADVRMKSGKQGILVHTTNKLIGHWFSQFLKVISSMNQFGLLVLYTYFIVSTKMIADGIDMRLIFVLEEILFLRNRSWHYGFKRET